MKKQIFYSIFLITSLLILNLSCEKNPSEKKEPACSGPILARAFVLSPLTAVADEVQVVRLRVVSKKQNLPRMPLVPYSPAIPRVRPDGKAAVVLVRRQTFLFHHDAVR